MQQDQKNYKMKVGEANKNKVYNNNIFKFYYFIYHTS